jgi:hypothetical protein
MPGYRGGTSCCSVDSLPFTIQVYCSGVLSCEWEFEHYGFGQRGNRGQQADEHLCAAFFRKQRVCTRPRRARQGMFAASEAILADLDLGQ